MLLWEPSQKRLSTGSAAAQVDGVGFLDEVAVGVFDDHATGNPVGAVD